MAESALMEPKPGHKSIAIGKDGRPYIEAFRCPDCGAVVTEQTMACRACATRTPPEPFRAKETAKLHTWSVVHRSYPGIEVPFVSAIVDLDGGPTLKGTVRVAPEALREGLPLRLVYDDAGGAKDKDGAPYIGFHFVAGDMA